MSEDREDFLLKLQQKVCGLFVEELQKVCELFGITDKDNGDIQSRTRRALVKLIIKFCEQDELLQREDEGMVVLLELNNVLDMLIEVRSSATATGTGVQSLPRDGAMMAETKCAAQLVGLDQAPREGLATAEVTWEQLTATQEQQAQTREPRAAGGPEDNAGQWNSAQRERLHQKQLLQCFHRWIQERFQNKWPCG